MSINKEVQTHAASAPFEKYIRLNVGGRLFITSRDTLMKQDGMLRAMFSGKMDVARDAEGWVFIDRDGKHFDTILNYLRNGNSVILPSSIEDLQELCLEAEFYCLSGLAEQATKEINYKMSSIYEDDCQIIMVTSKKQLKYLTNNSKKPIVKLMINRHNNKYSYTSSSDEMLMRNMELFDKLSLKLNKRVLFLKEVTGSDEICCWSFYSNGKKLTDISCTSIVYSTERKQNKVEFPEAKIYEETLNALLYEENVPKGSKHIAELLEELNFDTKHN